MEVQVKEEMLADELVKIKVIGVGGGGGNMVSHLMSMSLEPSIELIVANTDAQALERSPAPLKVQLGNRITRGLGAGMKPEVGKEAALESYEDIVSLLQGTDLVFIAAGMGGGTGTGAAPIIAKAAKEVGALTVGVVTKPFSFEGGKRSKFAEVGIRELKAECDSIIVIVNDKLQSMVDKSKGLKETFQLVDSVLARAVYGMSCVILQAGENDVNVDFADVRTIMGYRGLALVGMGESSADVSALDAIREATESVLFDNMSINGAKGLLINFHIHPDYSFTEMSAALTSIHEMLDDDATVAFGTYSDPEMPKDKLEVTVIATGLEKDEAVAAPTVQTSLETPVVTPINLPIKPFSAPQQIIGTIRRVSGGNVTDEDLDSPAIFRRQAD